MDEELPVQPGATDAEASVSPDRSEGFPLARELKTWVRDLFFAAVTAILIVVFVVQPVKVEGTSMQPHLADQERIFVNKFVYHFSSISRGDIVVFWYPRDPTKSFIKRVIGLPGEEIEIQSGIVHINGRRLQESYLKPEYFDFSSFGPTIVAPGHFFVLGDHRGSSNDSRNWGLVPQQNVFGKAIFRYWPVSKIGLLE